MAILLCLTGWKLLFKGTVVLFSTNCLEYTTITLVLYFDLLQVRTLFVSGLPMDVRLRELYLLFRCYDVSVELFNCGDKTTIVQDK